MLISRNQIQLWSEASFRSIQTLCDNFSKCLTENWGCKPTNGTDCPWDAWKNSLSQYMELWAPGSWQVRFSTHVKDPLIRKIVKLRDDLNFLQHFWSLQFHTKQTWHRVWVFQILLLKLSAVSKGWKLLKWWHFGALLVEVYFTLCWQSCPAPIPLTATSAQLGSSRVLAQTQGCVGWQELLERVLLPALNRSLSSPLSRSALGVLDICHNLLHLSPSLSWLVLSRFSGTSWALRPTKT